MRVPLGLGGELMTSEQQLACRCAGQVCRSQKGQREEEALLLEEAGGDIAFGGALRLCQELHLEGGRWPRDR